MSQCPGCGAEMKHIPAGVAKATGKSYEAFDTCSAKCGFKLTQKPGYTSTIVESRLPSKVPQPADNHLSQKTMLMSYAKDVIVAEIETGTVGPGARGNLIIELYRELCSEVFNPLK